MSITHLARRGLVALGAAVLFSTVAAAPAHAENKEKALVVGGEWKAYGLYNDDANLLCTRAYNSVSGAVSYVWITYQGTQTYPFFDQGGDQQNTCRVASALDGRGPGVMHIRHIGSGGAVNETTVAISSL